MLLSTVLMYATLAACGLGMGALVLKYDLHRHEPWWLIVIAIVLGAGMMEVAGIGQLAAVKALADAGHEATNMTAALLAATTEESAKFLVVTGIALCFPRTFDEPLDGLIYGALAGLGAAGAESIATLGFGQHSPFLPAQEPVRLAGHLVMGGIGAFGLGLLTNRSRYIYVAIPAGLALAMLLHWMWDVIAFDAADKYHDLKLLHGWHTALPVMLMVLGMVLFRWLVKVGSVLTVHHLSSGRASGQN